jgi:S-adenosylmethionine-dependent methyltransferase
MAEDPGQRYVQAAYDGDPEREWQRLDRHRTEFAVTLRVMGDYLPAPPARVLDVGGGPGRYAIELVKRGYEVTLFDLSAACLQMARARAAAAGATLAEVAHGTATDLGRYADGAFDSVLLMGPLYHLLEDGQRRQALAEAVRVLRPRGSLFAAFVTRHAVLRWAAVNDPLWPLQNPQDLASILETGVLPPHGTPGSGFVAWLARPDEVEPLLSGAGLELLALLGVEGLVSMIEEVVNALRGEAWDFWVDLNYRVATDPSIHGGVEHLLAVGAKPR